MTQHTMTFHNMVEFDALAKSISAKLRCDTSLIGVVNAEALIALGHSEREPRSVQRGFCARDAICAQVVRAGRPLRVADVQSDSELHAIPAVADMRIGAYLGVPLVLEGRGVVGAICVMSCCARLWQDSDVAYLLSIGDLVQSKIELLLLRYEQNSLSAALAESDAILTMLSKVKCSALTVHNASGDLVFSSSGMYNDLCLNTEEMLSLPHVARQLNFEVAGTGQMRVALPVAEKRKLNVHVCSDQNGLTLAEWSRQSV